MNTKVKKIFYNNELELNVAIENNIIEDMVVYKLVQIIPITEKSAYLVFTRDPDKIAVYFNLIRKFEDGYFKPSVLFPDEQNEDLVIMSFAELEFLRTSEEFEFEDEAYDVLEVKMIFDEQANIGAFVTVRNVLDSIPEYPESNDK